jgi:hypothetical protein
VNGLLIIETPVNGLLLSKTPVNGLLLSAEAPLGKRTYQAVIKRT